MDAKPVCLNDLTFSLFTLLELLANDNFLNIILDLDLCAASGLLFAAHKLNAAFVWLICKQEDEERVGQKERKDRLEQMHGVFEVSHG